MFMPNTRVQLRPALIGGLSAGVLWAAIGKMFTAFVVDRRAHRHLRGLRDRRRDAVWMYICWLILLLGAQLSFYIQNPQYLRLGRSECGLNCQLRSASR